MVLHTRRAASERPRRRNFTASLPASDDSAVPQPYFDAVVCLLLAANWPSPLKPLATRRLRPPNTAPGRRLPPQRSTTRALGAPLEQFPKFVRVESTRRVFRALQYHFTYTSKRTLSHARERAQDARRFHSPSPPKGVFTTRNAAMTFTRSRLWRTLHRATGFSCSGRRPATMKRARKNVSKAALMWVARKG